MDLTASLPASCESRAAIRLFPRALSALVWELRVGVLTCPEPQERRAGTGRGYLSWRGKLWFGSWGSWARLLPPAHRHGRRRSLVQRCVPCGTTSVMYRIPATNVTPVRHITSHIGDWLYCKELQQLLGSLGSEHAGCPLPSPPSTLEDVPTDTTPLWRDPGEVMLVD